MWQVFGRRVLSCLKVGIAAVLFTMTLAGQASVLAQARPAFPWAGAVPPVLGNGNARHHIIPWDAMVQQGQATFPVQNTLANIQAITAYLNNYDSIAQANLGVFQAPNIANPNAALAASYVNVNDGDHAEALETMRELFAWARGNLVIGPANRPNDPGNVFDQAALDCRQRHGFNNNYAGLQNQWNNQPQVVFNMLSAGAMLNNVTAANAPAAPNNNPPLPACAW